MTNAKWKSWVLVLLGLWVAVSPFMLSPAETAIIDWSHYIVGVVILATGFAAIFSYQAWEDWIGGLVGLWLAISPWLLGFSSAVNLTWSDIVCGGLVVVLCSWTAIVTTTRRA